MIKLCWNGLSSKEHKEFLFPEKSMLNRPSFQASGTEQDLKDSLSWLT
jgi:hypothetical protein